jgi:hypothetical protein
MIHLHSRHVAITIHLSIDVVNPLRVACVFDLGPVALATTSSPSIPSPSPSINVGPLSSLPSTVPCVADTQTPRPLPLSLATIMSPPPSTPCQTMPCFLRMLCLLQFELLLQSWHMTTTFPAQVTRRAPVFVFLVIPSCAMGLLLRSSDTSVL